VAGLRPGRLLLGGFGHWLPPIHRCRTRGLRVPGPRPARPRYSTRPVHPPWRTRRDFPQGLPSAEPRNDSSYSEEVVPDDRSSSNLVDCVASKTSQTHRCPELAIVIVNYNSWPDVCRLVGSLSRAPEVFDGRCEIVVVDNASDGPVPADELERPGV